jgi:ABC-type polysaccharide/polyol phosphate export permease
VLPSHPPMSSTSPDLIASSARVRAARRSPINLVRQGLTEMITRRRLTRYLVRAEMQRTHSDTLFGQVWWVLDPLLQMGVYYVLVTIIFARSTPDFPLFLFAAILPWKWFSTTLNDATMSITSRQSLIVQIRFPKIVLPTASVVAGTVSFAFGLVALGLVYLFYLNRLSAWVLLIPVIAVVQFVFTLAMAVLFSALNAFFRDIQNVLRHALRLWFYLSPGLYAADSLTKGHPTISRLLWLNPFTTLFESYRSVTWGTEAPNWPGLGIVLAVSLVLLVLATWLFKRAEPAFARIL